MPLRCRFTQRPERVDPLGAGVRGGCEPPDTDARNQTLDKNGKHS